MRRYLITNPELEASKELESIALLLTKTDKESFTEALNEWYDKYKDFINQRTVNLITNRSYYTHRKVRSVYLSLINNLLLLFTMYDNIELNTPNDIDVYFSDLKNKLRNHNGLSLKRKIKFIEDS